MALTVIFLMAASSIFAQRIIADKAKVNDLTIKIKEHQMRIDRFNNDLQDVADYSAEVKKLQSEINAINQGVPQTMGEQRAKDRALKQRTDNLQQLFKKQSKFTSLSWKRVERDTLIARVKRYENEKNRIFETYVTDTKVPKELNPREKNRRERGLKVTADTRKEANQDTLEKMGIRKLNNSPVKADPINGYEGFVFNLSQDANIQFKIYSTDDNGQKSNVEELSFFTKPGDKVVHKLLPGYYCCVGSIEGKEIGRVNIHVTPQQNWVSAKWTRMNRVTHKMEEVSVAEWTHWYVLREDNR